MQRAIAVGCLIGAMSGLALGQVDERTERARVHVKAAIAYYDEGKYEDAAHEMQVGYDLKPLPDLQYNLAQCYERLNKLEEAAGAYETYLAGKPGSPDGKSIKVRIANLRERARAQAAGQTPPPPVVEEKVVLKTIVIYRELPPPPGRAARWAAYGMWALAAAGAASGIAFAIEASQAGSDVTRGGNVNAPVSFDTVRGTDSNGRTDVIVSGVSFGIGALALAGGIGMYFVARKIDREAPKLTLAPSLGPASGGLFALGRY